MRAGKADMARRTTARQLLHDDAVMAAAQVYRERGRYVWLNPDGEKNAELEGCYVDVIASATPGREKAWVVEFETDDSVRESEAASQWVKYGEAFPSWHLAVPVGQFEAARKLVLQYGVSHCSVIMWDRKPGGPHTFWGLPGIE